ncbi:MAG: TIM barrel protein [Planctomycetia bacterium]|nr:TIM barrel protein [Planctomycetia bacterium]
MRESMYKYLKVGLVHFMAYPATMKQDNDVILESVASIAADPYFNVIEMMRVAIEKVRGEVKSILEPSGLSLAYAAQPAVLSGKLNINSLDEAERTAAVDGLKKEADMAVEMGSAAMALLSGPDTSNADRPAAIEACRKSLQELCQYADGLGIGIVLQVFDDKVDKKSLIGPSERAAVLSRLLDCKSFGLMADLSHLPLLGETPAQALGLVKDFLVHTHIGNCVMRDKSHPAYGDQHPPFGCVGGENGPEAIREFLKALFDIGFLGEGRRQIVSFEVKPLAGQSSEVVIAGAKRALNEAWAIL